MNAIVSILLAKLFFLKPQPANPMIHKVFTSFFRRSQYIITFLLYHEEHSTIFYISNPWDSCVTPFPTVPQI
ncbi:hypothetical protein SAMN05444392_11829 [Seinonella peptonophila]|uniref:Uncharacterized protein n=1 Tax=Seinonella peptonophila TaxID=112248 RepID=A0A1M5B4Q0_9BACL|nr:hypothetical protein SAMN05444392_11829 [Seinonella peptonophila]